MKTFTGIVIGKKMAKTATVAVERIIIHPVYKKRLKVTKKYQVQDDFDAQLGNKVDFVATKPISKLKRWKIVKVKK